MGYAIYSADQADGKSPLDVLRDSYTKHSFRGIVHPDDYERVNTSIWQQIYACTNRHDKENDAVNYRIVTKSGRVRWVIDRGRFVQSERYGRIFYVILIPDEQMDAMHAPSDKTDG